MALMSPRGWNEWIAEYAASAFGPDASREADQPVYPFVLYVAEFSRGDFGSLLQLSIDKVLLLSCGLSECDVMPLSVRKERWCGREIPRAAHCNTRKCESIVRWDQRTLEGA